MFIIKEASIHQYKINKETLNKEKSWTINLVYRSITACRVDPSNQFLLGVQQKYDQ